MILFTFISIINIIEITKYNESKGFLMRPKQYHEPLWYHIFNLSFVIINFSLIYCGRQLAAKPNHYLMTPLNWLVNIISFILIIMLFVLCYHCQKQLTLWSALIKPLNLYLASLPSLTILFYLFCHNFIIIKYQSYSKHVLLLTSIHFGLGLMLIITGAVSLILCFTLYYFDRQ